MRQGKLTNEELKTAILSHVKARHPDILRGAGVGEDCAVIRFGQEACVLSTDPITATTHHAGKLAVTVSVNDVAAAGAEPLAVMLTVLAPPDTTLPEIERVIQEASQEAARQGLYIVGGHTEVTDAVSRLVLSTTVVGKAPLDRVVGAGGAVAGDDLVMTKSAGLEGTVILSGTFPALLDEVQAARVRTLGGLLSVLPEGRLAAGRGAHAMHDATEGGVLGAAWEMAAAAKLGLEIEADRIPVAGETRALCDQLSIDPLRLIASGVLLIAHPEGEALCAALESAGIAATRIGRFLPREAGRRILGMDGAMELDPPEGDELYRALAR